RPRVNCSPGPGSSTLSSTRSDPATVTDRGCVHGRLPKMTWIEWYDSLAKPSWTPAPSTISLIWMILYPVIVASFGFVFVQAARKKLPWAVALPFAINLVANLLFMPIFAGLRSVPLAAADILVVWATLVWCVVAVWPHSK